MAEKLITFAKRGDLHARRLVLRAVHDKSVVKKLFDEIGPRFADRNGGYTRIVKLGPRLGDRAPMVLFELLGKPVVLEAKGEKRGKKRTPGRRKAEKKAPKKEKAKVRGKKEDVKEIKKEAKKNSAPAAGDRKPKAQKRASKKVSKI